MFNTDDLMDKQSCKRFCMQQHRYPTINKPKNLSKVSIVLFDMDGVLVDAISSWKFIHDHYNMNNNASVEAYVKGEIDDAEFIRTDVNMWMKQKDPMTKTKLENLLSKMPLMYGAENCFKWIKQQNFQTAIVSAGIKTLANRVAKELEITQVFANELIADESGFLTGDGIVEVPLKEKDKTVKSIHDKTGIPYDEMVSVGNSCYDIPMLACVGLGVAFNPADDCVIDHADEIIKKKDLSLLIPILKKYL